MAGANFQLAGPLQGHRLDHETMGGISLPFCPIVLRMLIPRYGKDFTDSPPNVLYEGTTKWQAELSERKELKGQIIGAC